MKNNNIGFFGILTLIFITLKLTSYISWSWWWVLSPILISALMAFFVILILVIISSSSKKSITIKKRK